MRYPVLSCQVAALASSLLLAACGGGTDVGGGETATTAEGVLKDANVAGLSYRSGDEEGATGADGSFTYEVGRDVTFFLGDLEIGTAPGQAVVTPLDFVNNGSTSSAAVLNRVRLLMMLDEDENPANGIQITPVMRDRAEAEPSIWRPVDFTITDENKLTAEFNPIILDLGFFFQRLPPPSLQDFTAAVARDHLEGTLRCVRLGAFRGMLTSGDTGRLGVMVDAATGELRGYALRNGSSGLIELDGVDPVSLDQQAFFTSEDDAGATFEGRMTDPDSLIGQWDQTVPQPASGTYQGTRMDGAANAVYRFTATYEGTADAGVYTFDINAAGNVTGLAYSVPNDRLNNLTGTLDSNVSLVATTSDQRIITATVDLVTGTLTNGFDDDGNALTGSGCRLN